MRPVIRDRGHADADAVTCAARSAKGKQCTAILDDYAHHATTCDQQGQLSERHDCSRDIVMTALRRCGVWVRTEQWVKELKQERIKGKVSEARLDHVVRSGARTWWVDLSIFHPFIGRSARSPEVVGSRTENWSLASRERLKHKTYVSRKNGRRSAASGVLVPLIANSYAGIGEQGLAFLALMRAEATKRGRHIGGKFLEATIQSAATYFTAVNILTAYDRAPSGAEPLVLAGGK
jgi:hypothetical protein